MFHTSRFLAVCAMTVVALSGCSLGGLPRGNLIVQDGSTRVCAPNPGGQEVQISFITFHNIRTTAQVTVERVWAVGGSGVRIDRALILPVADWAQLPTGGPFDPTAPQWISARDLANGPLVLATNSETTDDQEGLGLIAAVDAAGGDVGVVHIRYSVGDKKYEAVPNMTVLFAASGVSCSDIMSPSQ